MVEGVAASCRALRAGLPIVLYNELLDEGDLIASATAIRAQTTNAMVTVGRGLLAVVVTPERCESLALRPMPLQRTGGREICERTPTLLSVESRYGVSSGISAQDRATTISVLADPASAPEDLVNPGHVFPLVAPDGGVRATPGRLGAAVDAVRLANLPPVAAICDVLDENGNLAGEEYLRTVAYELSAPLLTVGAVIRAFDDDWIDRAPSLSRHSLGSARADG
jgi:3,4-dihydroxy 2-butanone 4-phosphate synthase / GTP cyclohydrolase II